MTLVNQNSSVTHNGNGVTTLWPYTFIIPDADSARVGLFDIALNILTTLADTDYSISGIGDANGGEVTYPLVGAPPASTKRLVIWRELDYTQDIELTNQAPYHPKVLETQLDRIVMQQQQLADGVNRSLKVAGGSAVDPDALVADFQTSTATTVAAAAASAASADSSATSSAAAGAASGRLDVGSFAELATKLVYSAPASGQQAVAAGDVILWRGTGVAYTVADTGAVDEQFNYTGTGGIKLYAAPSSEGSVNAFQFGTKGDDITDDAAALQEFLDFLKETGAPGILPPGRYRHSATLLYDTTGRGLYAQGPKLFGTGNQEAVLINTNAVGGAAIKLTGGVSEYMANAEIRDIGFEQLGAGALSHGLEYTGVWDSEFKNLWFDELTGSGIKCVNSGADSTASANVDIIEPVGFSCVGPLFDCRDGTGGVTLHTIHKPFAQNCGGADGMFALDGFIHMKITQPTCSGASAAPNFTTTLKAFVVGKAGSVYPRGLEISGGELGNSLEKGIVAHRLITGVFEQFRFVKRASETTFTTGFDFIDGASLFQGINVRDIGLQIDDDTPVFTMMYIGTGMGEGELSVSNIAGTFTGAANVYYSFGASVQSKSMYLEDINGHVLKPQSVTVALATDSATGAHAIDPIIGVHLRRAVSIVGAHSYTMTAGGNGERKTLTLINGSGGIVTITFGAGFVGINGFVDPPNGQGTSADFIYDSSSAAWRQIGRWSYA